MRVKVVVFWKKGGEVSELMLSDIDQIYLVALTFQSSDLVNKVLILDEQGKRLQFGIDVTLSLTSADNHPVSFSSPYARELHSKFKV